MKKCPFCAGEISDNATFCQSCGSYIIATPQPQYTIQRSGFNPDRQARRAKVKKTKQVWLAVALNFFPFVMGLGYIYLGNWKRFLPVFGGQILAPLALQILGAPMKDTAIFLVPLYFGSWIDVYYQAKNYNDKLSKPNLWY